MSVSWGGQKEKNGLWTLRRSLLKQLIRLKNGRLHMCHLLLWPDRATLLSEYGKTIKPSPRRESFRIFFIWGKLLIYFSFYTFFWVCAPGSAPTFLVLADMCGRAWRITSSTPQHCRPLFKPTFFSVEEIRLCKVFLPDLAILIHRQGSIEVSRNPRSNKLHIPAATCPHPLTRARSQQSCVLLRVSEELFKEQFLTFSSELVQTIFNL